MRRLATAEDAAEAVAARCHAAGVVHGDVKPSNILLDEAGAAVLSDFDLLLVLQPGRTHHVATAVAGTEAYLDPEVRRTGQRRPANDVCTAWAW